MDQALRAQEKEAEEALETVNTAEVMDVSQVLKYAPHAEALEEFLQVKVLHLKQENQSLGLNNGCKSC